MTWGLVQAWSSSKGIPIPAFPFKPDAFQAKPPSHPTFKALLLRAARETRRAQPTDTMARWLVALTALAVLLPAAQAQTGLGLGGLAPEAAPGPEAAVANIAVPTDLCQREFCLQAAPAACGGDCILTALGNTTQVGGNLSRMHFGHGPRCRRAVGKLIGRPPERLQIDCARAHLCLLACPAQQTCSCRYNVEHDLWICCMHRRPTTSGQPVLLHCSFVHSLSIVPRQIRQFTRFVTPLSMLHHCSTV
jgi:hypothetical protein